MKHQPDELLHRVAITLLPGVGPVLAKNLISYCGSAQAVFASKKSHLTRVPGIGDKTAALIVKSDPLKRAEKELSFMLKHNIQPLYYLDDQYPSRLKPYDDSPVLLYYKGTAEFNNPRVVGIVGTRKATEYGRAIVEQLLKDLAPTNCLVVSGLAFGIDIIAHREAMRNKLPTVGVVAHGLDRIYPADHKTTARNMLEHGGILTEFVSETNPDRENFPKRNRIVAALCDALVVVETALQGGAMITAEIANGYNKDVAAFPGRTHDEFSLGCNHLIRLNKAALITSAHDLCYLMDWGETTPSKKTTQHLMPLLDEKEKIVYTTLQQQPRIGLDDLAFTLSIESGTLALQLLEMELKGLIRTLPGKRYETAS
jgi:DNA processing protein